MQGIGGANSGEWPLAPARNATGLSQYNEFKIRDFELGKIRSAQRVLPPQKWRRIFPVSVGLHDIMTDEELGKLAVPVSMDGICNRQMPRPFKTIWILIGIGD